MECKVLTCDVDHITQTTLIRSLTEGR